MAGSAAGLLALVSNGCFSAVKRAKLCGDKMRFAAVGVWGKGFSDWVPMVQTGHGQIYRLVLVLALPVKMAFYCHKGFFWR